MRRVIRSEWLKLRRRAMLGALAATMGLSALAAVIAVSTAGGATAGPGGGGGRAGAVISLDRIESAQGLGAALASASTLLGVVALSVFASSFATEYSHGTLRNLLVNEPRRTRLALGKLSALVLATVGAAAAAAVAGACAASLAATAAGADTSLWWTAAGVGHSLEAVADLAAATVGWGVLGALLALAFRSPVLAIGVGVAYALPFEAIVTGVAGGVSRWLPGQLLAAVAAGGNDTATYAAAALTLVAYVAVAGTAAVRVFERRDVT